MLSRTWSVVLHGVESHTVEIEVDATGKGNEQRVSIVGLPDNSVRESRERIQSALNSSGFSLPGGHTTISLAPADIKKSGANFDLPMAIGILSVKAGISTTLLQDFLIVGELALDGRIRPVRGCLSMAIHARNNGFKQLIVPKENAAEASVAAGINVFPLSSLQETVEFLKGRHSIEPTRFDATQLHNEKKPSDFDFAIVKGQYSARRGLEIAAAGGHNILLIGSPGCGKSLMAKCFPSILPDLSFNEALHVTQIHSISGLLPREKALITQRPFRAPHHTISDAGLIGGSQTPRPGEISLAHHGVLFLDELPEFRKSTLEVLRQPLESGEVIISRASGTATFPAQFTLLAAMNPCPCGYRGSTRHQCSDSYQQVQNYRSKISGPMLDRIDIQIEVPELSEKELMSHPNGESSKIMRQRVKSARQRQHQRFQNDKINSLMSVADIQVHCELDDACRKVLKEAIHNLQLSGRAYDRILKIARTIADLDDCEKIHAEHLQEAIQYRTLDRQNT